MSKSVIINFDRVDENYAVGYIDNGKPGEINAELTAPFIQ